MTQQPLDPAERKRRREALLAERAAHAGWRQRLLARRTAQEAARQAWLRGLRWR